MGKIVILDEKTANQIAAGEVIERPSSVVKELVENSIDAGATAITVEIKNGGISLLKVTDNGSGIDEDDVALAFERFGTSKIRNADDLESVLTMGFRGEALASIASVSKVELITKTKDKQHGSKVVISGGALEEITSAGAPQGTSILIKDLFFNTPARYKFLKKDSTEAGYISDILSRLALAHPEIAFKLINSNQTVLHTTGNNDLQSAIFSVYGRDISQNIVKVLYNDDKVKITGCVGNAEIARANRNYQTVFINNRWIRSKMVSAAIDEAYKTVVMKNKFPFVVLNLEVNPRMIDINVHPTKMEVRFSDEGEIFRSIYHAINNALFDKNYRPPQDKSVWQMNAENVKKTNYVNVEVVKSSTINEETANGKSSPFVTWGKLKTSTEKHEMKLEDKLESKPEFKHEIKIENIDTNNVANKHSINYQTNASSIENNYYNENIVRTDKLRSESEQNTRIFEREKVGENTFNTEMDTEVEKHKEFENNLSSNICNEKEKLNMTPDNKKELNFLEDVDVIGQVFSTYIVLQKGREVLFMDQHAAHERVRFEELKEKFNKSDNISQELLAPVVIELNNAEVKFLSEKKEIINKFGFGYEEFGHQAIAIRKVPYDTADKSTKETFLDLVDYLQNSHKENKTVVIDEALYRIACKSAIKANKKLSKEEIMHLINRLQKLNNPFTCPHGRPTVIKITNTDLEKMFKRIV